MKIKKIWVDADACPKAIKEAIFRFGQRLSLPVSLVANSSMYLPPQPLLDLIVVGKKLDEADDYIVAHVELGDLVVTADIPLASRVVEKNVLAINPRGEIYDENNIGEVLSMRDFMKDLRDGGLVTGGPKEFGAKDLQNFQNNLNKLLSKK